MRRTENWPLFGFVVLVAGLWLLFANHESTRNEDQALLLFVGLEFALCVLIMLIWSEHWPLRSLGLLGTMAGSALLYFLLARPDGGWHWKIPQSLIRALFLAGGTALLLGMTWWVIGKRRGRPHDSVSGLDEQAVPGTGTVAKDEVVQ